MPLLWIVASADAITASVERHVAEAQSTSQEVAIPGTSEQKALPKSHRTNDVKSQVWCLKLPVSNNEGALVTKTEEHDER